MTKNKVVFITGASSGIGEALSYEYAKRGYDLFLCARRKEKLDAVTKQCLSLHSSVKVIPFIGDVTHKPDVDKIAFEIQQTFGRLDIVIANAGFGVAGLFEKLNIDDYRRQFETNIFGVLNTIYATLPLLKESRGRLAIMGSVNSYVSFPITSPYCMSKFAIRALADAIYWELKPHGISVTLICPGVVESEIRKTDNQGTYRAEAKDPAPAWLMMKTDAAARQMASAIDRRKKEKIITFHGKILVYIQRYMPFLLGWLLKTQLYQQLKKRPISKS